jgi:hypothetical protein
MPPRAKAGRREVSNFASSSDLKSPFSLPSMFFAVPFFLKADASERHPYQPTCLKAMNRLRQKAMSKPGARRLVANQVVAKAD